MSAASRRNIGRQICLRQLEFIEEAIFDNVDFVQIELLPQFDAAIADITGFNDRVLVDFALHAETPRLDIAKLKIRIEGVRRIGDCAFIGEYRSFLEIGRRQTALVAEQHRQRAQIAERQILAGNDRKSGIAGQNAGENVQSFANECD